jgi:spore germination protein GerM
MTRRFAVILLAVLAVAVVALLLVTRSPARGRRQARVFLRQTPVASSVTAAPGTTPIVETVRITLYFPSSADGKLRPEPRDIPRPSGPGPYLRSIYEELQRGPTTDGLIAPLPPKLQLRNAFLLPDGEVVLDLAVDAGLAFGSDEELAVVASLVNTVLQNVADTQRVRILKNGEPAETLGGHVDLTRPLLFLRSEVAP